MWLIVVTKQVKTVSELWVPERRLEYCFVGPAVQKPKMFSKTEKSSKSSDLMGGRIAVMQSP